MIAVTVLARIEQCLTVPRIRMRKCHEVSLENNSELKNEAFQSTTTRPERSRALGCAEVDEQRH